MSQSKSSVIKDKEHMKCQLKNIFHNVIKSFGFKENIVDQYIYPKVSGSKYIILVLFVYNILLDNSDMTLMHDTKRLLLKNFDMKDPGEALMS